MDATHLAPVEAAAAESGLYALECRSGGLPRVVKFSMNHVWHAADPAHQGLFGPPAKENSVYVLERLLGIFLESLLLQAHCTVNVSI